jgi:nucleoid DNA-binding protein
MAKLMSKSELIQKIAEQHPNNMTRKDVKGVIESLANIGYKEASSLNISASRWGAVPKPCEPQDILPGLVLA